VVASATLNFCTIIAKNYVAHARVLARSLAVSQPGSRLWTLIIDDHSRYIDPAQEPFEVLIPDEIGCQPFTHMALRYSVLELSTAVKPWLMRHLLGVTGGPVTYLDPDIKVYGSLERLDQLAQEHGLVLIPHNSRPIPPDGRKPSQVDIMIAGVYNLGYVTLARRPEVDGLLDWWADRLTRDCRVDPQWGYFVDQRWFDLAPGFVSDLAIVRDPEYNVAYWNLHDRSLEYTDGRYLVNGRPLAFFHFSGFDPAHPLVLSRHQNRVDVAADPVLERLLAEYAALVMAEGHAASRTWPYSYGALGDGTPLDGRLRALYDDFADAHGDDVASPFTLEGVRAFERWMGQQAPGSAPGVNRVLARVYEDRADVRAAFPDIRGIDRAGLLLWAEGPGRQEEPLLARVISNGSAADAQGAETSGAQGISSTSVTEPSEPLRAAPWGVNVVGQFRSELGMGEMAREVLSALDAVGISAIPVLSQTTRLGGHTPAYATVGPSEAPFAVNVICLEPEALPEFVNDAREVFFSGRYSAGLWLCDADPAPAGWSAYCSLLEEIWAPTAYVASALEAISTIPVHTIRLPVAPPPLELRSRAEFGLPADTFVFFVSVDLAEMFERQNPLAVVDAFRLAFAFDEGARLIIGVVNADHDETSHARLRKAVADRGDIAVVGCSASRSAINSLTAISDCFASLHRAEAFGFPLADAMWLGKPVIATGYSGNLGFMTADNSHLVDHVLIEIGPGRDPYPAAGTWAGPDLEHAAALMRRVFDDRAGAEALGELAAQDIRRSHSPEVAGEIVRRRLEAIRGTGRARRRAEPVAEQPPVLAKLPLRIRQGPQTGAVGGRGGQARGLVRKALLRTMKPYSDYQQKVNSEVVAGLGELNEGTANLREEAAAERAKRMAETRAAERLASLVDTRTRGLAETRRSTEIIEAEVGEIKRILKLQTDRSVYLAVSELARRHARVTGIPAAEAPTPPELTPFELRAFSQNGEDGVLAEILRRVGAPERFFVEFGVESGREGNCVYLADVAGWRGLFMEAGDAYFELLERKYAAQPRIATLCAMVGSENVERLFEQGGVPREPDVVSVDVDGQDYWIWEALQSYRPRVVIVEYNSALDPRRRLVQPDDSSWEWDGTEYYGASVGALQLLGERKGYRLVHTDLSGVNAFFVRSDLTGDAFPDPEAVALRGVPNYYQSGYRHPTAKTGSRYLDLDSGELVCDVH
jgi:glycosyltransferase involved in cell wall biosynthesis